MGKIRSEPVQVPGYGTEHQAPAKGRGVIYRFRHGERPLDGYTIRRGVGRGGFGEVYYGITDGGREVALKMLLHNEEIELRGVRQCINLKSPNLVSIFDVRTADDGTPFVVMEYVTGPSLRDLLREHPGGLGVQKAAFLVREIAKGLQHLHERGIVHRDLKPENIFYEEGYVKIGDYGLAKLISATQQSGQTISVGSVHYMAPEIGTGHYTQSIDIYALGVILFELLTGEVPFPGDSFGEILMKHLATPPDLSRIPEPFRSVLDKALKKDPAERFPSVDAMVRGIFDDTAITKSVSSFNPAHLTRIAEKFVVEGDGVRAAGSPVRKPAPVAPRATTVAPPPLPAPQAGEAPRDSHASYEPEGVPPILALRDAAVGLRQLLVGKLRSGARFAEDTIDAIGDHLARSSRRGGGVPPGPLARFFWVFLGSGLAAGAFSCFVSPFVVNFYGDELLIAVGSGLSLLGCTVFSFYRGLWARAPGFWNRSLKPFLLLSILTTAAIALACLILEGLWGSMREEEAAIFSGLLLGSVVLAVFIRVAEKLLARWGSLNPQVHRDSPRHERPVPVLLRLWDLLLTACLILAGVTTLVMGITASWNVWEQWGLLGFTVAELALAWYFYRQASRQQRGYVWNDTVRPFLLTVAVATLVICILPVLLGVPMGGDETMVLIVTGSIALGFCVPLLILRGPLGFPDREVEPDARAPRRDAEP